MSTILSKIVGMSTTKPTTTGTEPSNHDTSGPDDVQWLDPREQAAWRSFVTGARRLFDRLDTDLKVHGLSHDDYGVLVALSEAPDRRLRMAELAEVSVESRSRLTHHVGRLESRGLVRREACPSDRRGAFAVLTDGGQRLMDETAVHHVRGVRRHLIDQLSDEELAVIGAAFARIDTHLLDDPPD